MSLKALPERERPRERLARYGTEVLSSVEVLAILLGSGTKTHTVLDLAADLLKRFGSLQVLARASLAELCQVKGVGQAKALQIQAAFELARRLTEAEVEKREILDRPERAYQFIQPHLGRREVEMLLVLLRDVRRQYLHCEIIGKGTLTEVLIHPREIFHLAIRHRAHSLIVAHNHPSGNSDPSAKDLELTRFLAEAGEVIGIELADHIIVGKEGFTSLYKQGIFRKGSMNY